jgi:hypothetical protein
MARLQTNSECASYAGATSPHEAARPIARTPAASVVFVCVGDPPTKLQLGFASRLPKTAIVYQCPACEVRMLGQQRCEECGVFGRRLGPGGPCPHCDELVAISDLLAELRSITIATGR